MMYSLCSLPSKLGMLGYMIGMLVASIGTISSRTGSMGSCGILGSMCGIGMSGKIGSMLGTMCRSGIVEHMQHTHLH